MKPERLDALTSLRFFAAFLIVFHHSFGAFGFGQGWNERLPTYQAVSFFFVLSGFILTYVYRTFETKEDVWRFYIARFARIWPLHIFTLLLVVILFKSWYKSQAAVNPAFFKALAANIFLIQAWIPDRSYFWSFNAVSWSISTEFAFYLLFPFLILNFSRIWKRKLLLGFLLSVGIVVLCSLFDLPLESNARFGSFGLICIHPAVRIFDFLVGMASAVIYFKIAPLYHPGKAIATCLEIVMLSAIILGMMSNQYLQLLARDLLGGQTCLWIDNGSAIALVTGLFIICFAMEKGLLSKGLSSPIFVFLGEISFSIYLLHQIFIRFFTSFIKPGLQISLWAAYLYFLLVLFISSYVTWALIEKPFRKIILSTAKYKYKDNLRHIKKEALKVITNRVLLGAVFSLLFLIAPLFV